MSVKEEKSSNFWSSAKIEKLIYDAEENGMDYKDVDNPFHENDPELRKGNIFMLPFLYEMLSQNT